MPVGPIGPVGLGPEFAVPDPAAVTSDAGGGKAGFGELLASSIGKLDGILADASQQATQLATGQAADISSVVVDIERANLALQLAVQVRNKAVEAYQELFRMQV